MISGWSAASSKFTSVALTSETSKEAQHPRAPCFNEANTGKPLEDNVDTGGQEDVWDFRISIQWSVQQKESSRKFWVMLIKTWHCRLILKKPTATKEQSQGEKLCSTFCQSYRTLAAAEKNFPFPVIMSSLWLFDYCFVCAVRCCLRFQGWGKKHH